MSDAVKIVMIAAMDVEVKKFVRGWPRQMLKAEGRPDIPVWQKDGVAVAVVGAGWQRAETGTKVLIERLRPGLVTSIGFTGSLTAELAAGALLVPAQVIGFKTGAAIDTVGGVGRLVTASGVVGKAEKADLAGRYKAQAVDMEAAAVGEVALAEGVRFGAVKVVSDGPEDLMEIFAPFMTPDGFRMTAFVAHLAVRPRLWKPVRAVAQNAGLASQRLTEALEKLAADPEGIFGKFRELEKVNRSS